jgi:ribosomal protein L40E
MELAQHAPFVERICQHCYASFGGTAWRVKSEEAGVVFLNMVVCRTCYEEAKRLGLFTEKLQPGSVTEPPPYKT